MHFLYDIYKRLKKFAAERGRRRRMRKGWADYLEFRATLPYVGDSAELIREDRDLLH